MELREHALSIVTADTLEGKLAAAPDETTDEAPGEPLVIDRPARPPELATSPSHRARVPAIEGMADPAQKVRILHSFANHEMQAAELFAWALLAFPDAPPAFRTGLLHILGDEQRHCRMYVSRLAELETSLGDHPVSGYFWSKIGDLTSPLRFVCAMALTFESANLDHAIEYARAAREHGDERTAAIITRVHDDEVGHVRFGWRWLAKMKHKEQSMSEAYLANVTWPLRPALARGPVFHPESRRAAGLDEEFVGMLAEAARSP
ncbi:MAG: DUF455 family protein [Planctomycetota bacterium]|jgi:uncharacterized ferritin-like protein (DUF455 family)